MSGFRNCGVIPFGPDTVSGHAFMGESTDPRSLDTSFVSKIDMTFATVVGSSSSINDVPNAAPII